MTISRTLVHAADIASAYLKCNVVKPAEIASLIKNIQSSLAEIETPAQPAPVKQQPAVAVKHSITPDYLICLEDGHRVKTLKRYLRTSFGMTPHEYRMKWGLPLDYPMAAPNYTAARSKHALSVGFGRRTGLRLPKARSLHRASNIT